MTVLAVAPITTDNVRRIRASTDRDRGALGTARSYVSGVDGEHGLPGSDQAPWDAAAVVDARLEAMLGATSGPLDWRSVRAEDAPQQWIALRGWVDWFRDEFGFDHRVVPPCWYRHPALVNLFSALRDHWRYAYDPMNTSEAASDWHRALMMLEQRLRDWAARTGCNVTVHRADVVAEYPDDEAEWQQHMARDVSARQKARRSGGGIGSEANDRGWGD